MQEKPPPSVAEVIPELSGRGVLLCDAGDFADVALTLMGEGYVVAEIDGADLVDRRRALPAVAGALRLPGAADRNLDALADTLRDLPSLWPTTDRLVLLWRRAEEFIEGDPDTWAVLSDIFRDATEDLDDAGMAFETVAFVQGYDVPPLLLGVPRRGPRGGDRR